MSLPYAADKYRLAAESIALGTGPLGPRLRTAYRHHAGLAYPGGGAGPAVPAHLQRRIDDLHQRVLRIDRATGVTSVGGAVADMEPEEVHDIVAELVDLAFALARAVDSG